MLSLPISVGSTFCRSNVPYIVIDIGPDQSILVKEALSGERATISAENFFGDYATGLVVLDAGGVPSPNNGKRALHFDSFSQQAQTDAIRRWHYVDGLARMGLTRVSPSAALREAIALTGEALGDSHPPSESSVYRWWRRYLRAGCDRLALIPRYERRGGREKTRLADPVEAIIERVIREYFLRRNPSTGKLLLSRIYLALEDENKWRAPGDKLVPPSSATLYRRMSRIPSYERDLAHLGREAANRLYRTVGSGLKVNRLFERVEIDHTPLDWVLVDETSGATIGRPWLTIAIDAYSRMPCGYHLSYSAPCTDSILQCLLHVLRPKTEKIEGVLCEWPVYGVPELVVCDNGSEFHSASFESAVIGLGSALQLCVRRQPEFKGRIERFQGTLNAAVSHIAPGTTRSNPAQRGDYNSDKHACVSLSQAKNIIHKWLVDVYCQEFHRGIECRPIDMWNDNFERDRPRVAPSVDILKHQLGILASRCVAHDGIHIFGQRYQCGELKALRDLLGPKLSVQLKYFESDIGYISVQHPIDKAYFRVDHVDPSYACGLSLAQHEAMQADRRKKGSANLSKVALAKARVSYEDSLIAATKHKKRAVRKKAAVMLGRSSKDGHSSGQITEAARNGLDKALDALTDKPLTAVVFKTMRLPRR